MTQLPFPPSASFCVDPFYPAYPLVVKFDGVQVKDMPFGTEMTPTQVATAPVVSLAGAPTGGLYTLILSDPDAPSPAQPEFAEWMHWVVVNAPAENLGGGEQLTAYFGSAPGQGTGLHRYVLVAYAQPGRIAPTEAPVSATSGFVPRRSFNSRNFAAKYKLTPASALVWRAEYDDSVPALAKKLKGEA